MIKYKIMKPFVVVLGQDQIFMEPLLFKLI